MQSSTTRESLPDGSSKSCKLKCGCDLSWSRSVAMAEPPEKRQKTGEEEEEQPAEAPEAASWRASDSSLVSANRPEKRPKSIMTQTHVANIVVASAHKSVRGTGDCNPDPA
eukprot:2047893-Amphidinium_carterae.1